MSDIIKIHKFKDGKVMSENRTAYANGEYVLLSDYDKVVDELESSKSYITQLKHDAKEMEQKHEDEIAKFKENMMSVIRDGMKPYSDPNDMKIRIAELESELEVKDNLLKIKNGLCKPPMMTVIVAKTINGQDYVRLEDFISVVNDLQNYDLYHSE